MRIPLICFFILGLAATSFAEVRKVVSCSLGKKTVKADTDEFILTQSKDYPLSVKFKFEYQNNIAKIKVGTELATDWKGVSVKENETSKLSVILDINGKNKKFAELFIRGTDQSNNFDWILYTANKSNESSGMIYTWSRKENKINCKEVTEDKWQEVTNKHFGDVTESDYIQLDGIK